MSIRYSKFIVLFLMALLNGCATVPAGPGTTFSRDKIYLKDICDHYDVECQWDSFSKVVCVSHGVRAAKGLIGSNMFYLDGEKIILAAPLSLSKSAVVVSGDFKEKVIDRIKKSGEERRDYSVSKIKRVIIDAGHGGKDPGAIGVSGYHEKKVVLDIALRLKKILNARGVETIMTRQTDKFISLKDRTVIASQSKADLFISIHANAHASAGVSGIEVYSLEDLTLSEKNEVQRRDNHETMFSRLSMDRKDKDIKEILSDMLYLHKQAVSSDLASQVSRKAAGKLETKNLGHKNSRFYVLRNTLIPAILVEVGFLTNPKEEKRLKTKAYREKIAISLAESILEYAKN